MNLFPVASRGCLSPRPQTLYALSLLVVPKEHARLDNNIVDIAVEARSVEKFLF